MRYPLFALLSFGLFLIPPLQAEPAAPSVVNVLSFNLRYNNPGDGPNAWPHRKELAAAVFNEHQVDFAGCQEALAEMVDDLHQLLPAYDSIGVGREDGQRKGEFSPIFYRRDRFECEKQGTFWLSPTPEEIGSKGWDAALARIATWGVFRNRQDGREVFVINTHFDHRGKEARQESAKLLIARSATLSNGLPVVLTGDFNTTEETAAIATLIADDRLKLTNTERLSQVPHAGGKMSFNGFGEEKTDKVIDFIFVGPGVEVKTHAYFPIMKDGVYVSDHWPVFSQIVLPSK